MMSTPKITTSNIIGKVSQIFRKITTKSQTVEPESEVKPIDSIEVEEINHTRSTSFIFWFAGVVVVYVGYLLFSSLNLIYLVLTGYILSIAIEKMITWFQIKLKSRGRGIFLAYFIFIAVLLSGVLIMVPFLGTQFADLAKIVYNFALQTQSQIQTNGIEHIFENARRIPESMKENIVGYITSHDSMLELEKLFQQNIEQIAKTTGTYVQGAGGIAVNVITSIFNALTQVGFVFTLAVLFSIEKDSMTGLIRRFDRKYQSNRYNKVQKIYEKLGFWLSSQLLLCLFIFAMTAVGLLILSIFGIKLPSILSLAIIAGLTEMIPYVGPLLGSIPALLVGTINYGMTGFITVGILFFVIQWCENNILIPWIMNKTLGVSSLLIFVCMLIGASTLGFIGIVLAVPIAIIISIAMEE